MKTAFVLGHIEAKMLHVSHALCYKCNIPCVTNVTQGVKQMLHRVWKMLVLRVRLMYAGLSSIYIMCLILIWFSSKKEALS